MYNLGAQGVYPCVELISAFKNAIQTTKNHYFVKISVVGFWRKKAKT
jgi:hypothetical protein